MSLIPFLPVITLTVLTAFLWLVAGIIGIVRSRGGTGPVFFLVGALLSFLTTFSGILSYLNVPYTLLVPILRSLHFLNWASLVFLLLAVLPGIGLPKGYTFLRVALVISIVFIFLSLLRVWTIIFPPHGTMQLGMTLHIVDISIAILVLVGAIMKPAVPQTSARGTASWQSAGPATGTAHATAPAAPMADTSVPDGLPPGAAAFAKLLSGIEPAPVERGSVAGGVVLIFLGMLVFLGASLAPLALEVYEGTVLAMSMGLGLVVFVILLIVGVRMANAGNLASLIPLIREQLQATLKPGEEPLAIAMSQRMGLDFWFHGATPMGIIACTKYRVFLFAFSSAFRSVKKALLRREGVTLMVLDGADPAQISWGGVLMPATLNLMATKLTLHPVGKDKKVAYAAFHYGKNWKTLSLIKERMAVR